MAAISVNRGVHATLENKDLWRKFNELGTEMIITKNGRRMFPYLEVSFYGLDPKETYILLLDMLVVGDCKYKYSERLSQWVSGSYKSSDAIGVYIHHDGPFRGDVLKNIVFNKVKLTNTYSSNRLNQILLESMCRYAPRVTVVPQRDYMLLARRDMSRAFVFTFQATEFIAVTAYMNKQITQLKIDNNPFATGFRFDGKGNKSVKDSQRVKDSHFIHCDSTSPGLNRDGYQVEEAVFREGSSRECTGDDTDDNKLDDDDADDNQEESTDNDVLMYSVSTGEDVGDNIHVLHVNPSSIVVTDVPPSPSSPKTEPDSQPLPSMKSNSSTKPPSKRSILATSRGSLATKCGRLTTTSIPLVRNDGYSATNDRCLANLSGSLTTKHSWSTTTGGSLEPRHCFSIANSTSVTKTSETGILVTASNETPGYLATSDNHFYPSISRVLPDGYIELQFNGSTQNTFPRVKIEPYDDGDDSICLVTDVRSIRNTDEQITLSTSLSDKVTNTEPRNLKRKSASNQGVTNTSSDVGEDKEVSCSLNGIDQPHTDKNETELSLNDSQMTTQSNKEYCRNSKNCILDTNNNTKEKMPLNDKISRQLDKDSTQILKLLNFVNSHPMDVCSFNTLNSTVHDSGNVGIKHPVVDQLENLTKKQKLDSNQSELKDNSQSGVEINCVNQSASRNFSQSSIEMKGVSQSEEFCKGVIMKKKEMESDIKVDNISVNGNKEALSELKTDQETTDVKPNNSKIAREDKEAKNNKPFITCKTYQYLTITKTDHKDKESEGIEATSTLNIDHESEEVTELKTLSTSLTERDHETVISSNTNHETIVNFNAVHECTSDDDQRKKETKESTVVSTPKADHEEARSVVDETTRKDVSALECKGKVDLNTVAENTTSAGNHDNQALHRLSTSHDTEVKNLDHSNEVKSTTEASQCDRELRLKHSPVNVALCNVNHFPDDKEISLASHHGKLSSRSKLSQIREALLHLKRNRLKKKATKTAGARQDLKQSLRSHFKEETKVNPVVQQKPVLVSDKEVHKTIEKVDNDKLATKDSITTLEGVRSRFVPLAPGGDVNEYPCTLQVRERKTTDVATTINSSTERKTDETRATTSQLDERKTRPVTTTESRKVRACTQTSNDCEKEFPVILETFSLKQSLSQRQIPDQQQLQQQQQPLQQQILEKQQQLLQQQIADQQQLVQQDKHKQQSSEQLYQLLQKQHLILHAHRFQQRKLKQQQQQEILQQQNQQLQLQLQQQHRLQQQQQFQQQQQEQQLLQQQIQQHVKLQQQQQQKQILEQELQERLTQQQQRQQQQSYQQLQSQNPTILPRLSQTSVQEDSVARRHEACDRNGIFMEEHRKILQSSYTQYNPSQEATRQLYSYPAPGGIHTSQSTYPSHNTNTLTMNANCGRYYPSTEVKLETLFTFGSDFSRARAPDEYLPEIYNPTRSTYTRYSYHLLSSELPIIHQQGNATKAFTLG